MLSCLTIPMLSPLTRSFPRQTQEISAGRRSPVTSFSPGHPRGIFLGLPYRRAAKRTEGPCNRANAKESRPVTTDG